MRILHAIAGGEVGGAEAFFVRLAGAMHRAGVAESLVMRAEPRRVRALESHGLKPVAAPFGTVFDFTTTRILRRQIDEFRPDLVLSWMSRAAKFVAAARDGRDFVHVGRLGGYYDLKYYQGCDHLVANTPEIVDHIVRGGWPGEKAHFLANFVDDDTARPSPRRDFDTPENAPVILALGRLHPNKAFDVLLHALTNLPDAYLWLAGEGPGGAALQSVALELGVASRLRLLGWRTDVAALMVAADVLACPSRIEPLGNVVIEAWARGLPVVAAASAGPSWLIRDGKSGILVPVDDARALAEALELVLTDRELAARLAAGGRAAYAERFTEAAVVRGYLDLFAGLRR